MTGYEPQIRELFLNKPECIINFPGWMLSGDQINTYRNIEGLAIVEMAGRDSVAAAVKCVEEDGFTDLLPTYVYTGTEYGNWESLLEAVKRLELRLGSNVKIHELLVFGSPLYWRALNGRFIDGILKRYGFYTPCIGCHLYLHSARIPLSVLLGEKPVITGERESHDGGEKVNQISEAINAYGSIGRAFNVPILMPLRYIEDGKEIEETIGISWEQDRDQLGCVLSGNYRNIEGKNTIKKEDVINFLEDFALPVAEKIIGTYLDGSVPDHMEIAKKQLIDTGFNPV